MEERFDNQKLGEPIKEKEPISFREVWVIDDENETIESLLRFWKMKTKGLDYNFQHFETAQAALNEIKKRIEKNEQLPLMLFVDYELKKDKDELQEGTNFIKGIKSLNFKEAKVPMIVGHSTEYNQKMLEAGADKAFSKMEFVKSAEFLRDYKREK